jgi:hypothetical protein
MNQMKEQIRISKNSNCRIAHMNFSGVEAERINAEEGQDLVEVQKGFNTWVKGPNGVV